MTSRPALLITTALLTPVKLVCASHVILTVMEIHALLIMAASQILVTKECANSALLL